MEREWREEGTRERRREREREEERLRARQEGGGMEGGRVGECEHLLCDKTFLGRCNTCLLAPNRKPKDRQTLIPTL